MNLSRRSAWKVAGALAFVVAGLQYLALEAIAAAAWKTPGYSYARNYISDLGVPDGPSTFQDRAVHSPLAWVMNTAFVVEGGLFTLAAVLLSGLLRGAWRPAFVSVAVLHGIGITLVGTFPASADGVGAAPRVHTVGAMLAIVFGNLTVLLVGRGWRNAGVPAWFGRLSTLLPVLGLASEGILVLGRGGGHIDGVWERGGSYSVVIWEVLFGLVVLARYRRRVRPDWPSKPNLA